MDPRESTGATALTAADVAAASGAWMAPLPTACPQSGLIRWAHERVSSLGRRVLLELQPGGVASWLQGRARGTRDQSAQSTRYACAWLDLAGNESANAWRDSDAGRAWAAAEHTQPEQLEILNDQATAADVDALALAALKAQQLMGEWAHSGREEVTGQHLSVPVLEELEAHDASPSSPTVRWPRER